MTREEPFIPYGRQSIDDDDIAAVVEVLRSDWLTTGPTVDRFEEALAAATGSAHAVAVANGTAALHAAIYAAGVEAGDEVVVTPMTFAASANCAIYQGATPVFADVRPDTLLLDPQQVATKITDRTRAVVAVDYAGQPCDYDQLRALCAEHGLVLVADACHALGGSYGGAPVGTLADLSVFSFHPVKHLCTGEGGAITTDDAGRAARLRLFRNHGISSDHRQRAAQGSWFYEMVDLGFNYRLTDIQCALGLSQLAKQPAWLARRRAIAASYDEALRSMAGVEPLGLSPDREHAYHLYVVLLDPGVDRQAVFCGLRDAGIGVNVHYVPVHLHPYYRQRFGTGEGLCPVAEGAYQRMLSLPMFPTISDEDVARVLRTVARVLAAQGGR